MVRPWAEAGHTCYCVDIQHSIRKPRIEAYGKGLIHFVWGDVRTWTPPPEHDIRFVAGFPPCTDVAVSGARDFKTKGLAKLIDALELFNACLHAATWSGAKFCVENPVGVLSSHVRKPDHTFHPCDYGDPYTKLTCLWTGNGFVMPPKNPVEPTEGSKMHLMTPGPERANLRSATPEGFARAVF